MRAATFYDRSTENTAQAKDAVVNALVKYDAARKALAAAHKVDEVKDIRDQAVAMALYGRLAKDSELIGYATDIRLRAERRLGQLIAQQRDSVGLAKGAREPGTRRGVAKTPRDIPTLSDAGIDKNLAKRARRLEKLSEKQFEQVTARASKAAADAASKAIKSPPPKRPSAEEISISEVRKRWADAAKTRARLPELIASLPPLELEEVRAMLEGMREAIAEAIELIPIGRRH